MKVTVTVDLFEAMEDGADIDNLVLDKVADHLLTQLQGRAESTVAKKMESMIETVHATVREKTNEMLSGILTKVFEEEVVATDQWGNVTKKGSIRSLITAQFDNFLRETVDNDGRTSNYGGRPRVEYLTKQIMRKEMDEFTKSTVDEVKKAVKDKLTADLQAAVGNEIVNSIGVKNIIERLQLTDKTK